MASLRSARTPTCLNCLRRLTNPAAPSLFTPLLSWTQVRGARTMTKAEAEDLQGIPVRLLQDTPGFGRKFAIIRVKAGRMRNFWHHKGTAEYMTKKRFEELGLTQAAIGVRDRTFGSQLAAKENKKKRDDAQTLLVEDDIVAKRKEVMTLAPEEAHRLLTELLPEVLIFPRKPISLPAPTPVVPTAPETAQPDTEIRRSPALAANAAISSQARPQGAAATKSPLPASDSTQTAIFGSVSTADVLAKIREALLADQNGSRVALEAEGITILGLEEGDDRIKHLGRFEVDILTGKGTVRRVVLVEPEL